jgi:hypothetical protein
MTRKSDLTETERLKLELGRPSRCGYCNRREQTSCPRPKRPALTDRACEEARYRTAFVRPDRKSFLHDLTAALVADKPLPRRGDYHDGPGHSNKLVFLKGGPAPAERRYVPKRDNVEQGEAGR